jgi:hypothetical protein
VETFCTYTIYDEATYRVDGIHHPWPIQSLYIFSRVVPLDFCECFCSKGFPELLYVFVETFCTYSIYDPMEFYVIHVYQESDSGLCEPLVIMWLCIIET